MLVWCHGALNIPSRALFEPDGPKRRDWHALLVITAMVGLGVLVIGIEIAKCALIGGHM